MNTLFQSIDQYENEWNAWPSSVAQTETYFASVSASAGYFGASFYTGGSPPYASWSLNCHVYDSWGDQVRLKFVAAGGTPTLRVVDYFRPLPNHTLCDMLSSYALHEWSHAPDRWWRIPPTYGYYLGGSQPSWPGSAPRTYLSFWGGNSAGCCSVDQLTAFYGWAMAFDLYIMPGR
jgi:hypothetical protein